MFMKRTFSLLIVCILLLTTGCAHKTVPPSTDPMLLLADAQRLAQEGNYEEAILKYETIIEIDPKIQVAHEGLIATFLLQEDFERAQKSISFAESIFGNMEWLLELQESITPQPSHQEISEEEEPIQEYTVEPTPSPNVHVSDYEADYNQKIAEYAAAKSTGNLEAYSYDSMNLDMMYGITRLGYALFDVNRDGTPELIFADLGDSPAIIDLYSHNGGSLLRIFGDTAFGYRERLHILEDGRLLNEGSDSAFSASCKVYTLSPTLQIERTEAYYYDTTGDTFYSEIGYTQLSENDFYSKLNSFPVLHLDGFDWKSI